MGKKKENIQFDLSNYDYLSSSTPEEGWAWEFMRRSSEYRKAYDDWKTVRENTLLKDAKRLDGYIVQFRPFFGVPPVEPWSDAVAQHIKPWVGQPALNKANPVQVVNLKRGTGVVAVRHKPVEVEFLKAEKKTETLIKDKESGISGGYESIDRVTYVINGPHLTERHSPVVVHRHGPDGAEIPELHYSDEKFIHTDHPLDLVYKQQGKENVLMALIDISASGSAKDLTAKIEKEISLWRRRLSVARPRAAKKTKKKSRANILIGKAPILKSYLIVYDLVTGWPQVLSQDRTKEEVSEILARVDDMYLSIENINYHFNSAKILVNGGFSKLLN